MKASKRIKLDEDNVKEDNLKELWKILPECIQLLILQHYWKIGFNCCIRLIALDLPFYSRVRWSETGFSAAIDFNARTKQFVYREHPGYTRHYARRIYLNGDRVYLFDYATIVGEEVEGWKDTTPKDGIGWRKTTFRDMKKGISLYAIK